jgi:hypothetical protein
MVSEGGTELFEGLAAQVVPEPVGRGFAFRFAIKSRCTG